MQRKRFRDIDILENPHFAYNGERHKSLHGVWHDQQGIKHTGCLMLDDLVGPGMGMVLKPGDRIRVTVEVLEKDENENVQSD